MWTEEIWKPVPGYENRYEVSNTGRVRSLPISRIREYPDGTKRPYYAKGRELTVSFRAGTSANMVSLTRKTGGHTHSERVRALVAAAFLGPRPKGYVVRAKDGSKTNDRADNLYYGRWRKLTDAQVLEVRELLSQGETLTSVGHRYGLCSTAIRQIRDQETYKDVQ